MLRAGRNTASLRLICGQSHLCIIFWYSIDLHPWRFQCSPPALAFFSLHCPFW
ncbi:hypothetical protein E2C01_055623 [Portunus trituberculatus]|uniref:Uncharacterized protein n=1 Tax=Portunus trituberculatus TaxID=210409 RepID=A0A5B7GMY9_PORTR|nr:hypothetical protein [Portunus trituberculatus]